MKNKFLTILLLILFNNISNADNLQIEAKNISIDKNQEVTIFNDEVLVTTKDKIIKSDSVRYNKIKGHLILEKNIVATDKKDNLIKTEYAEYFADKKRP